MRRSVLVAIVILVVLAVVVGGMSFFQGTGVNRDNPGTQDLEGTEQP